MSTIPDPSLYSSANSSTATLRPRNTRLISYGDNDSGTTDTTLGAQPRSNSRHGRSRPSPFLQSISGSSSSSGIARSPELRTASEHADRRPSNGLWDSWSQLQGIASTILRSDVPSSNSKRGGALKSPLWMRQDHAYSIAQSAKAWGPDADCTSVAGQNTIEERQALIQAKKREALLTSGSEESRNPAGRFKRKVSNASININSSAGESTEDALVYRHRVQVDDTLAGVTIKYSCQPEAFRKINRFWPNDKIQIRKQVLLPVDACAIRGRKVDQPEELDLLREDSAPSKAESSNSEAIASNMPSPLSAPLSWSRQATKYEPDSEDYKHDSWVQLPSFSHPTEILRIPRRTLGYFPPARRKSNTTLFQDSVASSPRTSFDTLRHPPSHAAQQAQLHHQQPPSLSLNASPVRRPRLSTINSRQRSSSTVSTTSTAAHSHFIQALRGPGGVGTLRGLRTETARPGPADDSLNQRFAKYLPDVTPVLPNDYDSDLLAPPGTRTFSSFSLPRASTDSNRSARSNSSSSAAFGGGVESWMKNLKISRPGTNRTNSGRPTADNQLIGGETGLGDLIELEGSIDTLPGPTTDNNNSSVMTAGEISVSGGGTKADNNNSPQREREDNNLLNERFPIRGRITRAYGQD